MIVVKHERTWIIKLLKNTISFLWVKAFGNTVFFWLVMGCDKNFHESSMNRMNVISFLSICAICVKQEIHEWQFSPFIMILSENLSISAWFHVKSLKLRESSMNGNSRQWWSEIWFREMLKIAFKHEFSVKMNSLTQHYSPIRDT